MKNGKYLTFALPTIRRLFVNSVYGINDILYFAVYRAAMQLKLTADKRTIYRQLLYMAARHEEQVPQDFMDDIDEYFGCGGAVDLMMDSGEVGDDEVDEFIKYCEEDNKKNWEYEDLVEWYRVSLAQDIVGVSQGNIPDAIDIGKKYYKEYSTGQVPVSISTDSYFVFRDSMKTEYDRVKFAYYIAIRSLCGNSVAVTTSNAIKWRMVGARNADELRQVLRDKTIKSIWEKYTSKRKYHEIMNDLISSKLIQEMPYNRRTCITASLMNESQFVEALAAKIRTMNAARRNEAARQSRNNLQNKLKEELNKN